jgi:hypothetical protein
MPRVLCTLERASDLINGVRFASVPRGMLSENVDAETADYFASIPGYEIVAAPDSDDAPKRRGRPPADKDNQPGLSDVPAVEGVN